MDTKEIIKEAIIDSGKIFYDYSFNLLDTVQDQTEKTIDALLNRTAWINDENKKAVHTWINTVKTGRNNAKALFDQNIKTFEKLLGGL
jgi:hypothetical protein